MHTLATLGWNPLWTGRFAPHAEGCFPGRIAAEHKELVRTIDKAASHGAIHRNTAARKKSQAARVAAGTS